MSEPGNSLTDLSKELEQRYETYIPGPWRVIDETDILALEGTPSSIVVAATKFFQGPSTSWERANARLIAAAPSLLKEAKALIAWLQNEGGEDTLDELAERMLRLQVAIQSAEADPLKQARPDRETEIAAGGRWEGIGFTAEQTQ